MHQEEEQFPQNHNVESSTDLAARGISGTREAPIICIHHKQGLLASRSKNSCSWRPGDFQMHFKAKAARHQKLAEVLMVESRTEHQTQPGMRATATGSGGWGEGKARWLRPCEPQIALVWLGSRSAGMCFVSRDEVGRDL